MTCQGEKGTTLGEMSARPGSAKPPTTYYNWRKKFGMKRLRELEEENGKPGWRVTAKRVYRLYREMGLQLRNQTPKRRVKAKLREDRQLATRPNETWAMDFVHDQLASGRAARAPSRHCHRSRLHNWSPKSICSCLKVPLRPQRRARASAEVLAPQAYNPSCRSAASLNSSRTWPQQRLSNVTRKLNEIP